MSIRLIDTTTLRMKVFVGDRIPKYGILSHTWVEDAEIDLNEMTAIGNDPTHPARQKAGYGKILKTCELAKADGIHFVWIDTCCIDKSSSAELSEAINSMFKWYQSAEKCYAYLFDLPTGSKGVTPLGSCRWFTRGWTLQELIAPEDIWFYDLGWELVGRKMSLSKIIKEITGIDEAVITHQRALIEVPVAMRMSWASRRTTTRVEDTAYSLMGVFDVNMPLLYGEGNKAFVRLQEEIIKRSNDLTIFWNFTSSGASRPVGSDSSSDGKYSESSRSEEANDFACYQDLSDESCGEEKADELYSSDGSWDDDPPKLAQKLFSPYNDRDVFASSPRDFSGCDNMTLTDWDRSGILQVQDFGLTNAGVHFKKARIQILTSAKDGRLSFYAIPLGYVNLSRARTEFCLPGEAYWCTMLLRKFGPALFTRCAISRRMYRHLDLQPSQRLTEDAYVVFRGPTKPSESDDYVVRLGFSVDSHGEILSAGGGLQVLAPKDVWDAATRKFLFEPGSFRGYLCLTPGQAVSEQRTTKLTPHCYLACSVKWKSDLEKTRRRQIRVKLLPSDTLEKHWFRLAMGEGVEMVLADYADDDWGTSDLLRLGQFIVIVEVGKWKYTSCYEDHLIRIRFEPRSTTKLSEDKSQ